MKEKLLQLIPEQGILPLFFHNDKTVSIEVLRALYAAGIRAVEYTNRGEAALDNFKAMRALCDTEFKGMHLGVGTIKNGTMAQAFVDAGTDYIVCPGLIESVAAVADKNNLLWIPGCMTPTEIITAETMGARFIKLFPSNILGPEFVSMVKEIFPGLLFMPTGGVDSSKESLSAWFKVGVSAVGIGGKLISKTMMDSKDYTAIEAAAKQLINTISEIRRK